MDTLRLILLLLGLVLIVGIYWRYREPKGGRDDEPSVHKPLPRRRFGRLFQRDNPKREIPEERHIGPEISDEDLDALGSISVRRAEGPEDVMEEDIHIDWDSMTPVEPEDEVIIAFHILSRGEAKFSGEQIRQAAEHSGFVYGDMDIFHYYSDKQASEGIAVCSLANLFKPGHFDLNETTAFSTAGISLFMQLPGPVEAREAFKTTLEKARELAGQLNGVLCDETRSILTEQTVAHLREEVEDFRFKQQMAAVKDRRHER